MTIPQWIRETKRILREETAELGVRWLELPLVPHHDRFTVGAPLPVSNGQLAGAPENATAIVGVALLTIGGLPEAALYSHVGPFDAATHVDWPAVADRVFDLVGRSHEERETLARFLAANVGLRPDALAATTQGPGESAADPWAGILERLQHNAWEAPMLDLATGTVVRDARDFGAASLVGAPDRLSRATRVSLGWSMEVDKRRELKAERDAFLSAAQDAKVPPPHVEFHRLICDVTWTLALEDVFRLRLANPDWAEFEMSIETVTHCLVYPYHTPRNEYFDEYFAWVETHLTAMETAWRERRRSAAARADRRGEATELARSPVYGGDTIPKGAGFGGYAASAVKRVLRSRIDEVDHVEPEPDERDGPERRPAKLRTERKRRDGPPVLNEAYRPTVEMLQVLVGLGLAEVPPAPDSPAWVPTDVGRRVAGTSKAKYRRSSAIQAAEQMLDRALVINQDPDVLYHVETLLVFGSIVHGTGEKVGDVDVGVEWRQTISDPKEFHRRYEARERMLNEAAGWRFQWWMFVSLPLREVEQRLRGGTPILQVSNWPEVNPTVRETAARIMLMQHGQLVPGAREALAQLRHEPAPASRTRRSSKARTARSGHRR